MIHLYQLLEDKNGLYYISYNKKHRIKTLDKNNINYNIINVFDKKYIKIG